MKKLQLPAKKACIVADSTVAELYLEQVEQELEPLFEKVTVSSFLQERNIRICRPFKNCIPI